MFASGVSNWSMVAPNSKEGSPTVVAFAVTSLPSIKTAVGGPAPAGLRRQCRYTLVRSEEKPTLASTGAAGSTVMLVVTVPPDVTTPMLMGCITGRTRKRKTAWPTPPAAIVVGSALYHTGSPALRSVWRSADERLAK